MRTIVLYHAPCRDGLVAAWSLGLNRQTTSYIEYDHGKPGKAETEFLIAVHPDTPRIIAVDCFPEFIRGMADSVVVIDHHESAQQRLEDRTGLTEVVFDMTHSAAVLAWHWAHPHATVPELCRYVEDRDLWTWKLPHSKEVSAYIGTKPLDMRSVDALHVQLQTHESFPGVVLSGSSVLAAQAQVVTAAAVRAARRTFDGIPCAVVNCTTNVSEVGHELLELTNIFIAFMWRVDGATLNVSVRTHPDSPLKANEIAARFGGGGHPQAAGFHLPASWPLPFLGGAA